MERFPLLLESEDEVQGGGGQDGGGGGGRGGCRSWGFLGGEVSRGVALEMGVVLFVGLVFYFRWP